MVRYELDEAREYNAKMVMKEQDITLEGAIEFANESITDIERAIEGSMKDGYINEVADYFDKYFLDDIWKEFLKYIQAKRWNNASHAYGASGGNILRHLMNLYQKTERYKKMEQKVKECKK